MPREVGVTWLGHAAFKITSINGKVILIDPWITDNPSCPIKVEDLDGVDLILVTHDHFDHVGSTKEIVEKKGGVVVANVETAMKLKDQGIPEKNILYEGYGLNIGGSVDIDGIKITMVEATHSTASGAPCGYVVKLEDGTTIYHAGDTGIFYGMELIGRMYPLDLALVPIGSTFTMDPYQAAWSLKLLNPKKAIPMHYKTFPIIEQTPDNFLRLAREIAPKVEVIVLKPGEEYLL